MAETEVKLNWFQRHLNSTLLMPAVLIIPIYILYFKGLPLELAVLLVALIILMIISIGIWVIIQKGRNL